MVVWNDLSNTEWMDYPSQSNILRRTYVNGFLDVSQNIVGRKDVEIHGNVGIGTINDSPYYILDISGQIRSSNTINCFTISAGYGYNRASFIGNTAIGYNGIDNNASIAHYSANNTTKYALRQDQWGNTTLNAGASQEINFCIGNSSKAVLDRNGDVGIGTNNPGALLDVNGSIRAGYNTNTLSYFGRAAVGSKSSYSDQAYFGHLDQVNTGTYGNYAVLQNSSGATFVNSSSGQSIWFRNNNANKMSIVPNSYIGLYNTGSETKVHFYVSQYQSGLNGWAEVNFRNASGQPQCRIKCGQFLNLSDDRMKINEKLLTNATETLMKLKPQLYDQYLSEDIKNETRPSVGLIAQEVYYNAPELRDNVVSLPVDNSGNECTPEEIDLSNQDMENDPDYEALGWTKHHYASLNYIGFIPYLIKAIQEQQTLIETEKAETATLKTQVAGLLARLAALESA